MEMKSYTKSACVKIIGIAFKLSIIVCIAGFVFKFMSGSNGNLLGKEVTMPEILAYAAAMNSDATFALAGYVVCLAPFALALAVAIGYLFEKRTKSALLGLLLLGALMLSFLVQQ